MSKLKRYARIAEITSAITIVISVLYLGYEIRRNTTMSQMEAIQNLRVLDQQFAGWLIDPHISSIVVNARKDLASLSEEDLEAFRIIVWSGFVIWEHGYFNHEQGITDDYLWRAWNNSYCHWMDKSWLEIQNFGLSEEDFLPGFLEHVDACIARHSPP